MARIEHKLIFSPTISVSHILVNIRFSDHKLKKKFSFKKKDNKYQNLI